MKYSISLISKYRNELMGLAMIEVIWTHFINWVHIPFLPTGGILGLLIGRLFCLAHVPEFVLASGLGLFYSYSKNPDLFAYYKRRVGRLLLPYMLMAIPLVGVIAWYQGGMSIAKYLGWITTVGYWFAEGEQWCNMWYIAMSIVCYLFFPLFYAIIFYKPKMQITRLALLMGCYMTFVVVLFFLCPQYFELVHLAVPKVLLFILGIYFGFLSKNDVQIPVVKSLCIIVLFSICFFLLSRRFGDVFFYFFDYCLYMVTIPVVSVFIDRLKDIGIVKFIMKIWGWFGKYTLELYVLHIFAHQISSQLGLFTPEMCAYIAVIVPILICVPVHKTTTYISNKLLA